MKMTCGSYRPTWAEIDLDAIAGNMASFRRLYPAQKLMAVVKADAYGHGAIEVAREAVRAGADYIGVAFLDEALELRRSGLGSPILVLGFTPPEREAMREAVQHRIAMTFFRRDVLHAAAQAAEEVGRQAILHLKLDTGMNRVGVRSCEEAEALLQEASCLPHVRVEGMFTHFASADERDKSLTLEQLARFSQCAEKLKQRGLGPALLHCANSAAAIDLPQTAMDMLRIGISLYGIYPSAEVNQTRVRLRPAMSLKSELMFVKRLSLGEAVGYGQTYRAKGDEWIGTIPVGYADGFSRLLSNRSEVLLRGQRVPVVGRVSMDQATIRLPERVNCGEEVVLFGQQGKEAIPIEELAEGLGTIPYEVACLIGFRVPRRFMKNGSVCSIRNHLLS